MRLLVGVIEEYAQNPQDVGRFWQSPYMVGVMSKILGVGASALLTTAEVARRIGKDRSTVLLAVRLGHLVPEMQLHTGHGSRNGAYLFTAEAVTDWRCPGDRLPGL